MYEDFKVIVISHPVAVADETTKIVRLLNSCTDFLHLRKPGMDASALRKLLDSIPVELLPRIALHDHYELAQEYPVGGIHLNGRNRDYQHGGVKLEHLLTKRPELRVSRSCHNIAELDGADDFAYSTLSPIFDSISKPGYESRFDLNQTRDQIEGKRVVALGGVTPESFKLLREKEFWGAALLGYIWNGDFANAVESLVMTKSKN